MWQELTSDGTKLDGIARKSGGNKTCCPKVIVNSAKTAIRVSERAKDMDCARTSTSEQEKESSKSEHGGRKETQRRSDIALVSVAIRHVNTAKHRTA